MRILKYCAAAALLFITVPLFAFRQLPLELHLRVSELRRAEAPQVLNDYALFTYQTHTITRFVGIAFANENFSTIHSFERNKNGIFFYVDSITPETTSIEYRIVVDGLWMADPTNPNAVADSRGLELSVLAVPHRDQPILESPVVHGNGIVQFILHAPNDRMITVAGDFNNWDPFMDPLTEIGKGVYSVTLRVAPGRHAYYYLSDGIVLPDPLNPRTDYTRDGTAVSLFTVP